MEETLGVLPELVDLYRTLLREAASGVEAELSLEDKGWIQLSGMAGADVVSDAARIATVKRARTYFVADPLARQAVRMWTDYTFGSGLTFSCGKDTHAQEVLEAVWNAPQNRRLFNAQGQRKSCDKLLVDGDIFFALFLGTNGSVSVRRIDPLEITEIIADPEDVEDVKFYKREWTDSQGGPHTDYYRSAENMKGESCLDSAGKEIYQTQDALVYHLSYNTIGRRGNSLLTPVLDWIKEHRRFLASRVAIMLALARFAWKDKIKGGAAAVEAARSQYEGTTPDAGSVKIENLGSDLQPIKTDTGASNAYQDGRMLKLQVAAGVGIPEQYFGDISSGNLATAKTVELPMQKMFQSFQQVWADAYRDLFGVVFAHVGIDVDTFVDVDFPPIAPEDVAATIQAISQLAIAMPALIDSPEVQTVALSALGVNNIQQVLDALSKESNATRALTKALRDYRRQEVKDNVSD